VILRKAYIYQLFAQVNLGKVPYLILLCKNSSGKSWNFSYFIRERSISTLS